VFVKVLPLINGLHTLADIRRFVPMLLALFYMRDVRSKQLYKMSSESVCYLFSFLLTYTVQFVRCVVLVLLLSELSNLTFMSIK